MLLSYRAFIAAGLFTSSTSCAERRLLDTWTQKGRKKGVPQQSIIAWVRRKLGPEIVVWRFTSAGELACSVPCLLCLLCLPCLLCRKQLIKFGFRVTWHTETEQGHGAWYSGTLTEAEAPKSQLTSQQRLMLTGSR